MIALIRANLDKAEHCIKAAASDIYDAIVMVENLEEFNSDSQKDILESLYGAIETLKKLTKVDEVL
jgi:hypothetical protein